MNTKLISLGVTLGAYAIYYGVKYATPVIASKVLKRRAEKDAKLRAMDAEAIDVEWKVVEEF